MDPAGRYRIVTMLRAPYLLGFRHKKRRPRTSLDGCLVEPGGFEPASGPVDTRAPAGLLPLSCHSLGNGWNEICLSALTAALAQISGSFPSHASNRCRASISSCASQK